MFQMNWEQCTNVIEYSKQEAGKDNLLNLITVSLKNVQNFIWE